MKRPRNLKENKFSLLNRFLHIESTKRCDKFEERIDIDRAYFTLYIVRISTKYGIFFEEEFLQALKL